MEVNFNRLTKSIACTASSFKVPNNYFCSTPVLRNSMLLFGIKQIMSLVFGLWGYHHPSCR